MNTGQMVRLQAYGDKELTMRVVRQKGDTLIVCQPDEYDLACREKREPKSVGFHIKYLLGECHGIETRV